MADSRMKPSVNAHEIALDAWVDGKTSPQIQGMIEETGEDVTPGQVTAMIGRSRAAGDPRAIRHNVNANIIRAS